ncbi:mitochondrial genome maintenance protein [Physcia stellaris]|nr:mitochondrial genome maintenance protein [Physcia stellaris]
MLGGSSGINFMQFTFALRTDLDDWENLGNTGCNYESLAPYYKKYEKFQGASPLVKGLGITVFIDEAAHGYGGPVDASFTPFYTPVRAAWPSTLASLGLALNGDPRDGVSQGGYTNPMVLTLGTSQRSFAGFSYWKPYATRPNLHTATQAIVPNSASFIVNATKEFIISGGTMKSPQMLELSGISGVKLLGSFGIETLVENPNAGENLQDHPQNAFWRKIFHENGTGLLAGGVSQTAQLSWPQILGPDKKNRPAELVAKYFNSSANLRPGLRAQLDLKKPLDPNEQAVQTSGTAGHGSRPKPGEENKLAFIGGFVAHPLDFEVLKDLQYFSLNISTTPPMSTHLKGNGKVLVPLLTDMNDETVRDLINARFVSGWHVVGTCAMMPRDLGGVVDSSIEGFRDEECEGR